MNLRVYSFNGKTSVSKTEVPGSSPGGPATYFVFSGIILGMNKFKEEQFKSPEEELAFLRKAFSEKKQDYERLGVSVEPEKSERQVIAEYKTIQPKVALHPEFEIKKEE